MGRASGKIIHRDHWNNLLVEIIENGDIRSLYFAGNVLQSSMSLSQPHKLVLSYTKFMMGSLLFNEYPKKILMIGVGAGSLLRFINHHFPDSRVDAIDYSDHIIDLAQGYFQLPQSPQIGLECCDGFDYIKRLTDETYDLILIDAFTHKGMSSSIYCDPFFTLCAKHLSEDGLVSLNLWSGDTAKMDAVKTDLQHYFKSIVELPVPNRGNVICLAGKNPQLRKIMERDYVEISRLCLQFDIDFREIVKVCVKHNFRFKERVARFFS